MEDNRIVYALYKFKLEEGMDKKDAIETSLCTIATILEEAGRKGVRMQKLWRKIAITKEKRGEYSRANYFYKKAGCDNDVVRIKEKEAEELLDKHDFKEAIEIFEELKNEKRVLESWELNARNMENRNDLYGAIMAYEKAGLHEDAKRARKKRNKELRITQIRRELEDLEDKMSWKNEGDYEADEFKRNLWRQVDICKELGYRGQIEKIARTFKWEGFYEDAGMIYDWLGDKEKSQEAFKEAGHIWTWRDIKRAIECYERAGCKKKVEELRNKLKSD